MKWVSVFALICVLVAPAEARFHGGGLASGAPTFAPVLANATVSFGASTPNGRGAGVRLSGMDKTIPSYQPTTVSGLDLMSALGPACDTWVSFTFVSNTSGRTGSDFNVISSNTAEGTTAIAPTVSGTGANHLAGDYVWNVKCSAAGVQSNTATLTYHTVANMVTYGPADRADFGWAPTNFGSVAGAKVCLATGGDFHALKVQLRGVTLGSTSSNYLTFTVCDSGRYPYVTNMTTSGLSNIHVTDIVATGNTDVALNAATNIFGFASGAVASTNGEWDNLHYYGGPNMYPSTSTNSGQSFFGDSCSGTCSLHDSSADFVNSGMNLADYLHVYNVDIGHFSNNCFAATSTLGTGTLVDGFVTCYDGLISFSGQHTDTLQILDGATAQGITIKNLWMIQGRATGFPQGPFFGGTQGGASPNTWAGYIDDGTAGHGPGTVLTWTTGGPLSASFNAQIWSPGNIAIASNVRIQPISGTKANLINISATNIGSPASPFSFYNVGVRDMQMEGIINTNAGFHGLDSAGESGTSFVKHFAYVKQDPNPFLNVSFTASINGVSGSYPSGTTATLAGYGISSDPAVTEAIIAGGLNYSGCTLCNTSPSNTGSATGLQIQGEASSSEPAQATGTASFSGTNMTVTGPCTGRFDYDVANGSHKGGLLISGTGIPDFLYIIPQLFLPSDGCAGTYKLNFDPGTLSSRAVTGRPQMGAGIYALANYGAGATPTGPLAMTGTPFVGLPGSTAWVHQNNCIAEMHQGTMAFANGYATGGTSFCGAPVTNTTVSNIITPVAADYLTGVLPTTTLDAITVATWNAMTPAQKRAATCNAMLPAPGHALDLGGGDWIGPFTSTGEVILSSGNVAVTGCGIH